jgi:hypothetical protein
MFIISNSTTNNYNLLNFISTKSGGRFINAKKKKIEKVIEMIEKPQLKFFFSDFEEDEIEEIFPNVPTPLFDKNSFDIYGKISEKLKKDKNKIKLTITFSLGESMLTKEIEIEIKEQRINNQIIEYLYANSKINYLSSFPELFKKEIQEIGKKYSIVTPGTSLLILETLDQFLKYNITPPDSLVEIKKQFLEIQKQIQNSEDDRIKNKINKYKQRWQDRINWHKQAPFSEESIFIKNTMLPLLRNTESKLIDVDNLKLKLKDYQEKIIPKNFKNGKSFLEDIKLDDLKNKIKWDEHKTYYSQIQNTFNAIQNDIDTINKLTDTSDKKLINKEIKPLLVKQLDKLSIESLKKGKKKKKKKKKIKLKNKKNKK